MFRSLKSDIAIECETRSMILIHQLPTNISSMVNSVEWKIPFICSNSGHFKVHLNRAVKVFYKFNLHKEHYAVIGGSFRCL